MDGKGICLDNIPIERLWRTIKYEEVYLKTYDSLNEAKQRLATFIHWCRYSGINHHKPYEVITGKKETTAWSFKRADEYVDNCASSYHTNSQPQLQKQLSSKRQK